MLLIVQTCEFLGVVSAIFSNLFIRPPIFTLGMFLQLVFLFVSSTSVSLLFEPLLLLLMILLELPFELAMLMLQVLSVSSLLLLLLSQLDLLLLRLFKALVVGRLLTSLALISFTIILYSSAFSAYNCHGLCLRFLVNMVVGG